MHRAGQRCFEPLALIGSPQLSFSKVFPAEQQKGYLENFVYCIAIPTIVQNIMLSTKVNKMTKIT